MNKLIAVLLVCLLVLNITGCDNLNLINKNKYDTYIKEVYSMVQERITYTNAINRIKNFHGNTTYNNKECSFITEDGLCEINLKRAFTFEVSVPNLHNFSDVDSIVKYYNLEQNVTILGNGAAIIKILKDKVKFTFIANYAN